MADDSKVLAALAHGLGILFGFIPSLVIYLVKKDDAFVKEHAREALNFQLTMLIAYIVATILTLVVIGLLLLPVIGVLIIVLSVLGILKAVANEEYQYPTWSRIPFIKG